MSIRSSCNSEEPTEYPCAARNVNAMPPPMTRVSTFGASASMTPILSETLDPPSTTAYGRSGVSVSRVSTSTSPATSVPA